MEDSLVFLFCFGHLGWQKANCRGLEIYGSSLWLWLALLSLTDVVCQITAISLPSANLM